MGDNLELLIFVIFFYIYVYIFKLRDKFRKITKIGNLKPGRHDVGMYFKAFQLGALVGKYYCTKSVHASTHEMWNCGVHVAQGLQITHLGGRGVWKTEWERTYKLGVSQ